MHVRDLTWQSKRGRIRRQPTFHVKHRPKKMKAAFQAIAIIFAVVVLTGTCYAAQARTPQVALVAKLYKDFAFEAVLDEPSLGVGFLDSPRDVLLSYLTPSLAELIFKDRKCVADTHEICNLDFMPLWDSQDAAGAAVRFLPMSTNDKVKVELRYGSGTRTLIYFLKHTKRGWRIQNIAYEKDRASLLEILGPEK